MYHISCLAGAMLVALPAWAQDDGSDVGTPAPSLLEIQPEDRVLGDPDAPVTIFEFASLTCPHCATFHAEVLPELKEQLIDTGAANLVMRHFPLNQLAMQAALVADCVPDAQYYPFLDVLFRTQDDWAQSSEPMQAVLQTAMLAGAPRDSLTVCMQDEAVLNGVLAVRLRAQGELGVESTPTFFVGGVMLRGVQEYEVFAEAVAEATPEPAEPDAVEPEDAEPDATAPEDMESDDAEEPVEDESADAEDPAAEDTASEDTASEETVTE